MLAGALAGEGEGVAPFEWSLVMIRNCLKDKPVGGKGVPSLVDRCCGVAVA